MQKAHNPINLNSVLCAAVGFAILGLAAAAPTLAQEGYDGGKFTEVCNAMFQYLEGGLGALLAAVAGVGAIVASAAGGFRLAWALVIVSIGAFILREYIGIFFEGGCG